MSAEERPIKQVANQARARRLAEAEGARPALERRIRARVARAEASAGRNAVPDRVVANADHERRRPGLRAATTAGVVAVCMSAVGGVCAFASPVAAGAVLSNRAQAQRLYAALAVSRTESPAETRRENLGADAAAKRIGSCEAPFARKLDLPGNANATALRTLVFYANLLDEYQARVAPVRSQLNVLANKWALMPLANPLIRGLAGGLATELHATLNAPRFSACGLIRTIARDHFNFSAVRRTRGARIVMRFTRQSGAGHQRVNTFFTFIDTSGKPGVPRVNWLTEAQLGNLRLVPGTSPPGGAGPSPPPAG